jgi:N utilization substance protein A
MAMRSKPLRTESEVHSEMLEALRRVSDEQSVPVEALVESIEGALVSAYKKAYGGTGAVRVVADFAASEFRVFAQKRVVQTVLNPNTEVAWREARVDNPGINLGDEVEKEVTPSGFGRIAAQTAKQVLMQRLREAVRVQVVSEYADKSGQVFRGTVQRSERGDVIVQIGKAEAVMPRREQVPGEHYRFGETIYVYVYDVRSNFRGPSIKVSRTHPGLVQQLFEREVPEIADGIVSLKAVAREAGQRTKIAVAANNPDVDPVGACVGPRGMRVGKVVAELGNEKVDIVRWNADPITYISNALSPAQISKVILVEDKPGGESAGTATVIVAEDQQSLAIGKQGQNVRLAAKLTGWRIDIRTEKQYAEEQAKRMFDGDGGRSVLATATIRESADVHANLFPISALDDLDTNENGIDLAGAGANEAGPGGLLSLDTGTETTDLAAAADAEAADANVSDAQSAEEGSAAPLEDVFVPGNENLPVTAGESREGAEASGESDVSSVAPPDSTQA